MTFTGELHLISSTNQVSEKFRKREFVIKDDKNPEYPQYIKFQLTQNNCDMLDGYSVNEVVTVTFDIKGRAWTNPQGETTYFNSLDAYKISRVSAKEVPEEPEPLFSDKAEKSNDDLPF